MARVTFADEVSCVLFGHTCWEVANIELEEVDELTVLKSEDKEYKFHIINNCTHEVHSCTETNSVFEVLKLRYEDYYGDRFDMDKVEYIRNITDICYFLEEN